MARERSSDHLRAAGRMLEKPVEPVEDIQGVPETGAAGVGSSTHLTTSVPRILRASMYRQMSESPASTAQLHHRGSSSPMGTRKNTAPLVVLLWPSNSQTHTEPTR